MRTITLAVIAAILALAATLPTASADAPCSDEDKPCLGTITAGHALTLTLPATGAGTCRGPWTVATFKASSLVGTEFLSGGRVRLTIRADAQPGTRSTKYRLTGRQTRTREACSTNLIEAEYRVRAASRPSSVARPDVHLSSTPYRSQAVSNPSCYVVVTTHPRTGRTMQGQPYVRSEYDSISMTSCMTPLELYQNGFGPAVSGPPTQAAINKAARDYVNAHQCRADEHLPDSPSPGVVNNSLSNSCLQREGWTPHE